MAKRVDKSKAIQLRESGYSFEEISSELGCSVIWCKRNLKGVKKQDVSSTDYTELVTKGRSRECVTPVDINAVIDPSNKDKDERKKANRRVKDRLRKEDNVIIRQPWIHPDRAKFSYNLMLQYINMLDERLDEYVRDYLHECGFEDDGNYDSALRFMVLNSQYSKFEGSFKQGIFEAISNAVEKIDERNKHKEFKSRFEQPVYPEFISKQEVPY